MSTPILTTGRLILRPPVAEDADAIADILNIWEVTQWLTKMPFPYTRADAEEFLARRQADPDHPYWVIEIAGRVMGAISFSPDLGFYLAPQAHGKGLMTEAARAALNWRFAQGAVDVISGYHLGNTASARVQEKLGFRPTHDEIHHRISVDEDVTVIRTALTMADWQARDA